MRFFDVLLAIMVVSVLTAGYLVLVQGVCTLSHLCRKIWTFPIACWFIAGMYWKQFKRLYLE